MMKAVSIKALKKTYANGLEALKGVDIEVETGDFFALLGPNGAGKSTLIGILISLVNKTSGTVEIFGHDIDKDLKGAKQRVGVVPQEFNFGIFENVEAIVINQAGYYGIPRKLAKERTEELLESLGLIDKRKDQARMLSGGMKRRLMIARGLIHKPDLLILDEPTAGVDIELRRSMWDFLIKLNTGGTTIILTTHYLEEAENLCRNIAIIDKGLIVEKNNMKDLLRKLDVESFIFDLQEPLSSLPEFKNFEATLLEEKTLEIRIHRNQSNLSSVFEEFKTHRILVNSMKNKSNRLEEFFLRMVEKGK
ncbi:MAG: ABC transporter ATP-binding protein [Leptospiraceae bacterium]|nr:ABC transporter ATP-binding protein [Leptospiraceae bacterium]